MSAILEISQSEFEQKALQAEGLVIVDFSATWCGPCKRMHAELEALAPEIVGKATILQVDVDESPELAMRYGVQGIPNLTFLKGGQVVDTIIGAVPKAHILAAIQKNA